MDGCFFVGMKHNMREAHPAAHPRIHASTHQRINASTHPRINCFYKFGKYFLFYDKINMYDFLLTENRNDK
jgi:hypothetical protein